MRKSTVLTALVVLLLAFPLGMFAKGRIEKRREKKEALELQQAIEETEPLIRVLAEDGAYSIRYELLSDSSNAMNRWLRSGTAEYTRKNGVSFMTLYGSGETLPCAELWWQDNTPIWNLGLTLDWLVNGDYSLFSGSVKLLSGQIDKDLAVSTPQMERVFALVGLHFPSFTLTEDIDAMVAGMGTIARQEKTELPLNTRLYGSIRELSFYQVTLRSGETLLVGYSSETEPFYIQKQLGAVTVELYFTPRESTVDPVMRLPDTDKAESIISALEILVQKVEDLTETVFRSKR